MHENTRSFADPITGQREQGMRSEEASNTHGLTQAQRQAVEKLEADHSEHGTGSADSVELMTAKQDTLQPPQRGTSRHTVLRWAGLTIVGVAGSSLVLLACAKPPAAPASRPVGTTLYTYRGHSRGALRWMYGGAVAWSPDGTRIASGGVDGTVQVWDAVDGSHVYTYRGHSNSNTLVKTVKALAWSPDGTRIASGGNDVQVWDATNGGNVYSYRGHTDAVKALAWSPDGTRIASGGSDVQVWNVVDGSHVYTYRGHFLFVNTVAWSPDGTRIASGDTWATVQVWNAADGSHVYTYSGHSQAKYGVNTLAWSPDGTRIASSSMDKTVQVWDATNGGNVYTYRGHSRDVMAVAWSPDGTRIASLADKTVKVWVAERLARTPTRSGAIRALLRWRKTRKGV